MDGEGMMNAHGTNVFNATPTTENVFSNIVGDALVRRSTNWA